MSTATRFYTVRVHEAEEGGYWAEVLDLPGCASQGETKEELKANLLDAIEAVTEASADDVQLLMTE